MALEPKSLHLEAWYAAMVRAENLLSISQGTRQLPTEKSDLAQNVNPAPLESSCSRAHGGHSISAVTQMC